MWYLWYRTYGMYNVHISKKMGRYRTYRGGGDQAAGALGGEGQPGHSFAVGREGPQASFVRPEQSQLCQIGGKVS